MATQQKGIEDYRNAVKLLKLKVIKLQKLNEELNEKLREQGIPVITDDKSQGALTNQNAMQAFSKSCKRLGLSPEMLFRASDIEGTGSVKVEDFRLFMSKVRLGLNQSQVTLIVRIMDEDCSGIVNKDEYYDCLQAYGINEEKSNTGTRTYGQTSLLKFAKLLLQAKMSPEDSWTKMDAQTKGSIIPSIFSNFVHAFDSSGQLNEKEIVATFNHIDLDKQGTIQKFFYEQEVRKAMKATASDLGLQGSNIFGNTAQSFNIPSNAGNLDTLRPQTSGGKQSLPSQSVADKQSPRPPTSMVVGVPVATDSADSEVAYDERRQFKPDMGGIAEISKKLQAQGINIIAFIRGIMDKLANPAAGVMLYDVYQAFEGSGKKIQKQDQLRFFQILDIGGNGSIDYDELMVFYLLVKKQTDPFDGLFEILTRKLQADELDIAQYLSIEQVYEDTELSIEEFFPIAEILFNVPDREVSDALFKTMDTDGQGVLSAQEIIVAIRAIMDVYCPPKVLQLTQNLNHENDMNLNEYHKILRKLKPVLTQDDFFDKRYIQGKKVIKRKWKTILNSDLACLKFCYDLVMELEKTPGAKWSDPEFGSTPTDQYGSKSMYFADNDIAKGCPDPKEVLWLRPEEVIATQIENGYEEYEGINIELFDADGAGANDVMQSPYLGNCWFVSALSIIARYDKYLQGEFTITEESIKNITEEGLAGMQFGVYPPCFQFLVKYGIYVMRFYKNFGWRYVVIDDRLAYKGIQCVYGKCRKPTENWVNMIEKAYAKIHNCYFALTSGDIAQGLADMTGLAADKTKFDGIKMLTKESKDELWLNLVESKENGTMMGCSAEGETEGNVLIKGEDTGVMSGHAYSIIDVFELKDTNCKNYHKSHRLILLRNPWGRGEWKLKWSENPEHPKGLAHLQKYSKQIDTYYDGEIKKAKDANQEAPERYTTDKAVDDGLFLICYKDWRRLFSNLFQCMQSNKFIISNFPESWSGSRGRDRFGLQTSGVPKNTEASQIAYAMKNPQYIFDLNRKDGKETVVWVQFKQIDGRLFWAEKYPYTNIMRFVLLCIFKLDQGEPQLQKFDKTKMIASSGKLNLRREIDSDNMKLKNGRYAIIPCSKDPGDQVDFSINVYYDCSHEEIKLSKVFYIFLQFVR